MHVKIHHSYRNVISICDEELIGKKFEEDIRQLDVRKSFYEGDIKTKEEVIKLIQFQKMEDSTFNIVGPNSVACAIEAGLITEGGILTVDGVPFTLTLL